MYTTDILVTRTEVLRSGTKNGRAWVLYDVHCTRADGTPFYHPVHSFDKLEAGLHTVEMEPERRGDGFIARLPRPARKSEAANGGTGCDCAQLKSRVERLEKQMLAIINNAEVPLP